MGMTGSGRGQMTSPLGQMASPLGQMASPLGQMNSPGGQMTSMTSASSISGHMTSSSSGHKPSLAPSLGGQMTSSGHMTSSASRGGHMTASSASFGGHMSSSMSGATAGMMSNNKPTSMPTKVENLTFIQKKNTKWFLSWINRILAIVYMKFRLFSNLNIDLNPSQI